MSSPDWRIQPLKGFWQSVNWENRPITQVSNTSNGKVIQTLSLLMPVKEYFRAISWTGVPAIAATIPDKLNTTPPSIDDNSATLEDFLDDVSKFF